MYPLTEMLVLLGHSSTRIYPLPLNKKKENISTALIHSSQCGSVEDEVVLLQRERESPVAGLRLLPHAFLALSYPPLPSLPFPSLRLATAVRDRGWNRGAVRARAGNKGARMGRVVRAVRNPNRQGAHAWRSSGKMKSSRRRLDVRVPPLYLRYKM